MEKIQDFFIKNYRLKVAIARNYDPEGYIGDLRLNKLKERSYHHQFYEIEDLLRNALPIEAVQRKKKWELLKRLEKERMVEDENYKGIFIEEFQYDIARMIILL